MNELKYQKDTPLLQLLAQLQEVACHGYSFYRSFRYRQYRRMYQHGMCMRNILRLSRVISNEAWGEVIKGLNFQIR